MRFSLNLLRGNEEEAKRNTLGSICLNLFIEISFNFDKNKKLYKFLVVCLNCFYLKKYDYFKKQIIFALKMVLKSAYFKTNFFKV